MLKFSVLLSLFAGLLPCYAAEFMTVTFDVRHEWRSRVPAVVHVDGTARVQTVNQQSNPILHELLTVIGELTGVPVLLNTSFNLEDEPIVCRPADAFRTFARSELDELFIGRYIVSRKKNL